MPPATPASLPPSAALLHAEIAEQPAVAARQLASAADAIGRVAALVAERGIRHVAIAARGTSDNAAIYGQYLLGIRNRLPVALAAPSLTTLYETTPRYDDALVIGISQSGASPDVAGVVAAAREQGALTLALTNDPGSTLGRTAEHVAGLDAGPERSIAATKTYTAELVALAALSVALDGDERDRAALAALPGELERALEAEPAATRVAADQAALERVVVLGRGIGYATAREWSLKLREIAGVWAEAWSAADFAHGPLAMVGPGTVVLATVPRGAARDSLLADLARLRGERGAELLVLSDDPAARRAGRWSIQVPAGHPEWLDPIVAIVPAQLHCLRLALARGVDPGVAGGLTKVTLTR